MKTVQIHPRDNVAVALEPLSRGAQPEGCPVLREDVPQGHKLALRDIPSGGEIVKYGCVIGFAKEDIPAGAWVHTHNVRTGLSEDGSYAYHHKTYPLPEPPPRTFQGYRRPDGRAAVRNELWVLPTVGCVNAVARRIAQENQHLARGGVEGVYAFTHPFGCSQMGGDHAQTRRVLAALARHPNAGGVLVVGLGCENLTMEQFRAELGEWDERRVKFLVCQDSADELADGARLLAELAEYAGSFRREAVPAGELVVGLKCGGSDGLSGITANPVYENPSPGNKAGGITTLEDKSCGCVQKGGSAQITDVLPYGGTAVKRGLNLLSGPGNDLVSTTALTAAGAHIILFTTGRGTPFGAPAPTVKIATNTDLFTRKPGWLDFNAGTAAQGESLDAAGERLLSFVLKIAGGERTKAELRDAREISIWKDGVVL